MVNFSVGLACKFLIINIFFRIYMDWWLKRFCGPYQNNFFKKNEMVVFLKKYKNQIIGLNFN